MPLAMMDFNTFVVSSIILSFFALKGFGKMSRFFAGPLGKTTKHGAFHIIGRLLK